MKPCLRAALLAAGVVYADAALAEVKLASPFTSHMVLQREMKLPVWGTAEAGEQVSVSFAGKTASTRAGADGKWRLDLAPLAASSEGRRFAVSGSRTAAPLALDDVLVGEVWLAAGQSNMDFSVSVKVKSFAGVKNEEQEIAAANYPLIRMFTGAATKAYEVQGAVGGEWQVCSPATVPAFSAAGYFFARELQKEIKVPVGIITMAYGASTAEAWVRRGALAADPALQPMLDSFDARVKAYMPPTPDEAEKYQASVVAAKAAGQRAPRNPWPDPVQDQHNATVLYNGMLAPVIPYAIRGALWYQGESIVGGDAGRLLYPRVQNALVNDWRAQWGQGDFPFYIVQLAGQDAASNGPLIRQAQASVLALKNTGMAVTYDIGEVKNVHPHNKQDVGDRLARIALAQTYGRQLEYAGPQQTGVKAEGSALRLSFSHLGGGLVAKGGAPLRWFELAGADGKFVAADARIDGATVLVSSAQLSAPRAVRYAWAAFPDGANLFNQAGLPAAPFQTELTP